jgi:hypothetical protein
LFEKPIPASSAYAFGRWLVRDWQRLGLGEQPETFPRQPKLKGKTRLGNWVRLPGRHHTLDFYSQVWTGQGWATGKAAVEAILQTGAASPTLIPKAALTCDADEQLRQLQPRTDRSIELPATCSEPVRKLLKRLKNVRPSGDGWTARCPAHTDRRNSLSVAEGDDGRALAYCHAGCDIEEIVATLDLSMSDLFARSERRRKVRYTPRKG